jgi:uncharacterized radical SAM superfamily protein
VSVTGGECALHCNHCDGHYLQHMVPVGAARPVLESGEYSSILLSGGADRQGRLPLVEQLPFIEWVRQRGIRINAHVGLQSDEDMRVLAPLLDRVSLDYVWDGATIRDVYHLACTGADYLHAAEGWAEALAPGPDAQSRSIGRHRVNLHLTIGLKGGVLAGEFSAIDSLVAFSPASLVFLVLIPTEGTAYSNAPVVAVEAVESVFSYARKALPSTDLVLGCMHPRAAGYGDQLAQLAKQYGFRGIVGEKMPDDVGEQMEECCVFYQ